VVPLFAFAPTLALITLGAFLMQIFVQGAWGVIPAHLSELSPRRGARLLPRRDLPARQPARRGQPADPDLAGRVALGGFALAAVIVPTLLIVILLTAVGSERHSADFGSEETSEAADRGGGRFRRTAERTPTGSPSG
jgi:SHS family lactate transporter-like MFS transporter